MQSSDMKMEIVEKNIDYVKETAIKDLRELTSLAFRRLTSFFFCQSVFNKIVGFLCP
jgi:hypothetical protein